MNGYEEWIEQAQDINTALYNLEGDKLEAAGFFFQQAA